jgi:uncharacterized protein DUF3631/ATPase family protein associated with various cellular activities (AAA)
MSESEKQAGWPDRYRPCDLESMALAPEVRERFAGYLTRGVIPRHLVLYGEPGFGKTTLAEILATKLYYEQARHTMRVEATKTGNVDFIRDQVVGFMRVLLGVRLVIFQEASGLTPQAAAALKVPLEDFADNCRVIFTTNDLSKLESAIQSRCDVIEIVRPPLEECARVLEAVLKAEGIQVEPPEVLAFTTNHFGVESESPRDMRSLLGAAQHSVEVHGSTLRIPRDNAAGWGDVWPHGVDGNQLLADLSFQLARYLVLPEGGIPAVALWTLYTWVHEVYAISPILAVVSPTMESGKSTVFDILEFLCPGVRGTSLLHVAHLTPASLHHLGGLMGADDHPEEVALAPTPPVAVLLADEVDAWMKAGDMTRAALDGGYSRSQAFKLLASGRYSTWYPKGLALIERDTFQLPATVKSRSFVIRMKKVLVGPEEFRIDRPHPELTELKRKAARWASDHWFELRNLDPPLPQDLVGRARQSWRIFFGIAGVVGETWPQIVENTWRALNKRKGETLEQAVELIIDIHTVFESDSSRPDRLPTQILLEALHGLEDRPWKEMGLGVHKLSRMLHPFEIRPKALWASTGGGKKGTRQGYFRSDFEEAFKVYVGTPSVSPQEPEEHAISK